MLTNKIYKEQHYFYRFAVANEGEFPKERLKTAGPVFTAFMTADFKSKEGFKKFADNYGFDWLATVGPCPLLKSLKKDYEIPGPGEIALATRPTKDQVTSFRVTPESFASYYLKIKNQLMNEQKMMRYVYSEIISGEDSGYRINALGVAASNINDALRNVDQIVEVQQDGTLKTSMKPRTLIARCWLEIYQIINDKVKLRPCANCGILFMPVKSNQKYCQRLQSADRDRTCQELGPVREYQNRLNKDAEKKAIRAEYMRLLMQVKRKADKPGLKSAAYRNAEKALDSFKKENDIKQKRKG